MSKTPEALQMATFIDQTYNKGYAIGCERTAKEIAAELRRLHAANVELVEHLVRAEKTLRLYPAWEGQADECARAIAKHGNKS